MISPGRAFFWILASALFLPGSVAGAKHIRGVPGKDYPDYYTIPLTSFRCSEQHFNPGFYADPETRCQVFHHCYKHRQESFLCPLGTIFNQAILACDYWYSADCDSSIEFHDNLPDKTIGDVSETIFKPIEKPSGNLFAKMASLYEEDEFSTPTELDASSVQSQPMITNRNTLQEHLRDIYATQASGFDELSDYGYVWNINNAKNNHEKFSQDTFEKFDQSSGDSEELEDVEDLVFSEDDLLIPNVRDDFEDQFVYDERKFAEAEALLREHVNAGIASDTLTDVSETLPERYLKKVFISGDRLVKRLSEVDESPNTKRKSSRRKPLFSILDTETEMMDFTTTEHIKTERGKIKLGPTDSLEVQMVKLGGQTASEESEVLSKLPKVDVSTIPERAKRRRKSIKIDLGDSLQYNGDTRGHTDADTVTSSILYEVNSPTISKVSNVPISVHEISVALLPSEVKRKRRPLYKYDTTDSLGEHNTGNDRHTEAISRYEVTPASNIYDVTTSPILKYGREYEEILAELDRVKPKLKKNNIHAIDLHEYDDVGNVGLVDTTTLLNTPYEGSTQSTKEGFERFDEGSDSKTDFEGHFKGTIGAFDPNFLYGGSGDSAYNILQIYHLPTESTFAQDEISEKSDVQEKILDQNDYATYSVTDPSTGMSNDLADIKYPVQFSTDYSAFNEIDILTTDGSDNQSIEVLHEISETHSQNSNPTSFGESLNEFKGSFEDWATESSSEHLPVLSDMDEINLSKEKNSNDKLHDGSYLPHGYFIPIFKENKAETFDVQTLNPLDIFTENSKNMQRYIVSDTYSEVFDGLDPNYFLQVDSDGTFEKKKKFKEENTHENEDSLNLKSVEGFETKVEDNEHDQIQDFAYFTTESLIPEVFTGMSSKIQQEEKSTSRFNYIPKSYLQSEFNNFQTIPETLEGNHQDKEAVEAHLSETYTEGFSYELPADTKIQDTIVEVFNLDDVVEPHNLMKHLISGSSESHKFDKEIEIRQISGTDQSLYGEDKVLPVNTRGISHIVDDSAYFENGSEVSTLPLDLGLSFSNVIDNTNSYPEVDNLDVINDMLTEPTLEMSDSTENPASETQYHTLEAIMNFDEMGEPVENKDKTNVLSETILNIPTELKSLQNLSVQHTIKTEVLAENEFKNIKVASDIKASSNFEGSLTDVEVSNQFESTLPILTTPDFQSSESPKLNLDKNFQNDAIDSNADFSKDMDTGAGMYKNIDNHKVKSSQMPTVNSEHFILQTSNIQQGVKNAAKGGLVKNSRAFTSPYQTDFNLDARRLRAFTNLPSTVLKLKQKYKRKFIPYPSYSHGLEDAVFSPRTGNLFESPKIAKLVAMGKNLLRAKKAKFRILRRYVNSLKNDQK